MGFVPILRGIVPLLRGFVPNLTLREFVTVRSLRGCIKPSRIDQVFISEKYKEHKIFYCYENECNGAANFKSVSVFTTFGLLGLLYFVTKY